MHDFAVFILTHGRPQRVKTLRTLRRLNYTGAVYLVVDNEDASLPEYQRLYGDAVLVFDKAAVARTFDEGDNFGDRRAVIYARNACFDLARQVGVTYFLQLDDDYRDWYYQFTPRLDYAQRVTHRLDDVFEAALDFYKAIPAATIAMGQTGDLIGGQLSSTARVWLKRKAMNSFFCSTERPFQFVGRINEDVNTYLVEGNRGRLFMTFYLVCLSQVRTQQNEGGMTELYLETGTYVKSFYSVMYTPSCVKVMNTTGTTHQRLHHRIHWEAAVPRILSETYRKG